MHHNDKKLEIITREAEVELMTHYIDSMNPPVEILDAGSGRKWGLTPTVPYRLTGVDSDANAVALREQKFNDLAASIVGDLKTVQLPREQFDVIFCSYVLEHVDGVNQVLLNFLNWLKSGGLMIIRVPDRDSVYGWVTRHSPFWLHVFYKRWFGGITNAGKPGFPPYPVFYDQAISRGGMATFCEKHHLDLCEIRGVNGYPKKSALPRIASMAGSMLSLGTLPWRHNNLLYIIRKP